ncbi:MAG: serine protease [Minicystis sp.]
MSNDLDPKQVSKYSKAVLSTAAPDTESPLESLSPGSEGLESQLESILEWMPDAGDRREEIATAIDHLRTNTELDARDLGALEAIILPTSRPVSDIRKGKIVKLPAGEFRSIMTDAATKARVETAIASVGCILVPSDPHIPYGGTGFVVGPGLVMTNRHVARIFADGLGINQRVRLLDKTSAAFNPLREDASAKDQTFAVKAVRMIHPYWDMALLEVPDLQIAPLRLASLDPEGPKRKVVVVGYPAFDPRNNTEVQNTVFHNRFFVKRLSPGYVNGRRIISSFENQVNAATHDASTLGGNSGSAIIDVETGCVIALHFAGLYLDSNFAVPVSELAKDSRVIDAGVSFAPPARAGTISWQNRWDIADESPSMSRTSLAGSIDGGSVGNGATVRVTIPIELTVRVGQVVTVDPSKTGG